MFFFYWCSFFQFASSTTNQKLAEHPIGHQNQMSNNTQEIILNVQEHLQKVDNAEVGDLDDRLTDQLISLVTIDKSVYENKELIKELLVIVVKVLHNTSIDIDFNKLIELLDGLLSSLDFESVVELFKLSSIVEALNSPNENLQILALKVSSKANPPDIISNTEIVPKIIHLLATKESSIKVVNEVEKALGALVRGELIRRRLLSDSVISVLSNMKSSKDTTLKTRLLDLVVQMLPFVKEDELPDGLYLFSDFTTDNDILYTLSLIQFYTQIIEIVDSTLNKQWLLQKVLPEVQLIGKLYFERHDNPDVEYFALTDISLFFKKLSFVSPETFKPIDQSFIKLTHNDNFLLSSINPSYLAIAYPTLLKGIRLTADTVPVFRNLISDESSFHLIQPEITTEKLQRLSYLEFVAVLNKLSQFQYSAKYLLQNLPQIMNKLLQGGNVIEPESFQLRKDTIEKLLAYPDEDLSVWKEALVGEQYKLTHGAPMKIQSLVHDGTI